ncbi:MAG TPA: DUF6622 family protein [Burkholderiaceae bacterium]
MITMLLQIVQHTPVWVWGLLAGLVAYGVSQARDRELSLTRLTILPLVMLALSFSGVVSAFAHAGIALLAWAAGIAVALSIGRPLVRSRGARWSSATGLLHVPGSWMPLALMVAVFLVKYVAGVTLALHPELAANTLFGAGCGLAYGTFSGLFAARALGLRRLAVTPRAAAASLAA